MIDYSEIYPHEKLSQYVVCYWYSAGFIDTEPVKFKILPDGCCDIIFNLGEKVLSVDNLGVLNSNKTYIIGTATKYSEIYISGKILLIGIRFKPLGMKAFIKNLHLAEYKNQSIELEDINIDMIFKGNEPQSETIKQHIDSFLLQSLNYQYITNSIVYTAVVM